MLLLAQWALAAYDRDDKLITPWRWQRTAVADAASGGLGRPDGRPAANDGIGGMAGHDVTATERARAL